MLFKRQRLLSIAIIGSTVAAAMGFGLVHFLSAPIPVRVAAVRNDVPIQVFGLGTVEAETVSRIGFETAGTLVELKANHGDFVKRGALLARLHSAEQDAHVAQARAAVMQARAGLEQATTAVEKAEAVLKQKSAANDRRQQLVQRGVVSHETAEDTQASTDVAKADLVQAKSGISVAQANLQQAEALLALEEAKLAKYSLYAPYDALVMTRYKELGSALNANEFVFQLVDPATSWALAYIDEARAGPIEVGQPAEVTRRSAPDMKMKAKVVRIDIESDRVNEERRIYARCNKPPAGCPLAFHLGEQAEIVVTVATLSRALLVKLTSLTAIRGREATAWTVEGGRLRQRQVTLGQRTLDGRVEIASGVPPEAHVVDGPTAGLKVGRKATILPSEAGK